MQGFLLFFLLAVLFGFVFVVVNVVNALTGTRRPRKSRFQTKSLILAPIRQRFGAENMRASRLGELNVFRPAVEFDYGRTMARLKHFGRPWRTASHRTVLETHFLLQGIQLKVASRLNPQQEPAFGHMEMEDEDFNRDFFVYTNEPALAKRLLTDAVKWKMTEIKNLQKGLSVSEVRFELANGKLEISTSQWFGSGTDLLDFVQGGLELFDQLMLHKADGLEFTQANQAAVMEDFRCPICSNEVMQDMVVCKRCKTPHCAECWEYNGKCATFACMEERCIRVQEQDV